MTSTSSILRGGNLALAIFVALLCISPSSTIAQKNEKIETNSALSWQKDRTDQAISKKIDELIETFDSIYSNEAKTKRQLKALQASQSRLRGDKDLPEEYRLELASLIDYEFGQKGNRRMTPFDRALIAKSLIEEFPEQPSVFIGLLVAAEAESDLENSNRWAQEILGSDFSPDWVRDRAQCVLDRNDLVGLSLKALLGAEGDALPESSELVVYTWIGQRNEELKWLTDEFEKLAMNDTPVFSLCIDPADEVSRLILKERVLPGTPLETSGVALARLRANLPFLVYRCDAFGIIRSVSSLSSISK